MTDDSRRERLKRTILLYGDEAVERLRNSRVALFGLGGVGGYTAEALARSGVGALDLFDPDTVSLSNLNRQVLATTETLGRYKVDVAEERIALIAPDCTVKTKKIFYLPENAGEVDLSVYDYVADAIDTVSGKLAIIEGAKAAGVPVISSMGTGNKRDPSLLRVDDLSKTTKDPLSRVMRRECRKRGIGSLKVVWSPEEPVKALDTSEGRRAPGSGASVPGVAGLIMASVIINDLTETLSERGNGIE